MASVPVVSSVLVLMVLVGLWALVLVPAFRQRQERVDALRSVDRFSSTLRVLSRRGHSGGPDRRWIVMPARPGQAPARSNRPATQQVPMVVRRRRTLGSLAAVALLSLALVVAAGSTWLLVQLPADAALGAVAVWCARSTARERARRASAARRAGRAGAERAALAAAAAPVWSPARVAPARERVPVTTVPLHGTVPDISVARPAPVLVAAAAPTGPAASARAEAVRVAVTGRLVVPEAVEVEEPFVAEPTSGVRLIDLTTPGAWTRRRILDDTAGPEPELEDDGALEGLLDRRTAASGW